MRQAIVIGLGAETQPFLQKTVRQFTGAEKDQVRALLLTPTTAPEAARPLAALPLRLNDAQHLQQLYYDPHVRKWCAANWGKWGGALLDTRLFGKLAAYVHLEAIYQQIDDLDAELAQENARTRQIPAPAPLDLYLVAHLDEPFASGALLDLAYLLDYYGDHARGTARSVRVYGLLLLPTPSGTSSQPDSLPFQSNATTYAALRELAFVQGSHSFYENHHPRLEIKKENHSPFESGGCFVVGGSRDERGGELNRDGLHDQLVQWIRICSFTPVGDQVSNRLHLRSRPVISTFGLQRIADPARPQEQGSDRPTAPERAQARAALHALVGPDRVLDDEQRQFLQAAVHPFRVDRSDLQRLIHADQKEGATRPPSQEDSDFRAKAARLLRREADLRADLDSYHQNALRDIWRTLIESDRESSHPENLVFADALRLGAGSLELCAQQCRVLFNTAEEEYQAAQKRLTAAESAAEQAAAKLFQARGAVAYTGYQHLEQPTWTPVSDQNAAGFVLGFLGLLLLLWVLVFLMFGTLLQIPVLLLVTGLVLWLSGQQRRSQLKKTYADWQQTQADFLNEQVNLVAARLENEAAQKLYDALARAFTVAKGAENQPVRWQADQLRDQLLNPLTARFEDEPTPAQTPIIWATYNRELWAELLADPHDADWSATAERTLVFFIRTQLRQSQEATTRNDANLGEVVAAASRAAACMLHLNPSRILGDQNARIAEFLLLPTVWEPSLSGGETSRTLRLADRDLPTYLDDRFRQADWERICIRLRPEVDIHALFGIETWRMEYHRVLEHDNFAGNDRFITRAQLHPTRVGIISPDPARVLPADAERLGGYPYSVAIILLAALLRQSGNRDAWREWATQLRVDGVSQSLDWLNFDELCGAMQEQPETVLRLLEAVLQPVPLSLNHSDEADFSEMLNIMPLTSETYADWEVWAQRQMRAAFSQPQNQYAADLCQWLLRCWVGLRQPRQPALVTPASVEPPPYPTSRTKPPRFNDASSMRIGIWGTPQVGKTMYLLMLLHTLEAASSNWTIDAVDDHSYQFWKQNQKRLRMEHRFPEKTVKTIDYGYWIGYKTNNQTEALFELSVTDTAGELHAEFFIESQRDKKVKVRQRLTESLESDLTPRDIFQKLLTCEGIIILIDPISQESGGTPPDLLLTDLLEEIRSAKDGNRQAMPFIALCLTKIDGEDRLWQHRDQHPAEHACTRTTGPCPNCLVYEQLQTQFMTHALNRLYDPDYVRCFVVSSVGRKYVQVNGQNGTINVSSSEKWQRPYTPIYGPAQHLQGDNLYRNCASALDSYRESGFLLPRANDAEANSSSRRQFMPTLIDDYQSINPYNIEKPLEWLYLKIAEKRGQAGAAPAAAETE